MRLDGCEIGVLDTVLAEHRPHCGVTGRPDDVGRDAAAFYVLDCVDRTVRQNNKVLAEIAGVAIGDHIRDEPLVEMRIGDRERERACRERGDFEIADRLGLDWRGAVEAQRLQDIALAQVLEHRGLSACRAPRSGVPGDRV